jgi:t-SNARE complex subunit (syntaxin)
VRAIFSLSSQLFPICQKWLKDRKGHRLEYKDVKHYQLIIAAPVETIRLMDTIDTAIAEHGGWPIIQSYKGA